VPGTVDKIAADDEFEDLRSRSLSMMSALVSTNPADAFKIQDFINDNKEKVNTIVDMWISFLRDISIIHCGAYDAVINSDKLSTLRSLCTKIDLKRCVKGVELLVESQNMLSKFVKSSAVLLRCALLL
jgi:hypothetical protein